MVIICVKFVGKNLEIRVFIDMMVSQKSVISGMCAFNIQFIAKGHENIYQGFCVKTVGVNEVPLYFNRQKTCYQQQLVYILCSMI